MSSDDPPNNYFNGIGYNSLFYEKDTTGITQAQADLLYLSKIKTDTSTAALTTFNGDVTIKGTQQFGVQGVAGGITNINRRLRFNDVNGNATGYGDMVYGSGPELYISSYSSAATLLQTYIKFQTCPTGSTTPALKLEITNDVTRITNILKITSGELTPSSQLYQFNNDLVINNVQAGATTYFRFNNTTVMEMSTVQFTLYTPLRLLTPTYSFPLASQQIQGYYLKNTGIGTTVVSATPTSILTTSSISVGVWRVDFSVQNTVTTAGTITSAQSYIATSAAPTTPLAFTGALIRTHVSEVYAINDIQIITSSFTMNVSTAGTFSLTIVRSFSTGAYTFIGEVAFTRIA